MTESEVLVELIRWGLTRENARFVYECNQNGEQTGYKWYSLDNRICVVREPAVVKQFERNKLNNTLNV